MKTPTSILVLRLGGIGDLVTATPAARALRGSFPGAFITLCAEKTPSDVIRHSPYFDDFIIFDDLYRCQNYLRFLTPAYLRRIVEFVKTVRKRSYDLCLDFHDLYYFSSIFKPWLVGWISGAQERIGLDTDGRGFFLTQRIRTTTYGGEHMIDRSLKVAGAAGAKPQGRQTEIWLAPEDKEYAKEVFEKQFGGSPPFIFCIHPGANIEFPLKFWPVEKFIAVARYLISQYRAKILILGGRTDEFLAQKMQAALGEHAVNFAGQTTIRQLGALIERSDFYLGADTGPMHMAVAAGTPSVGIFGPGNYPVYGTYGSGFEYFHPVWHRVKEFPWTKSTKVEGNPYMDAVSAAEVIEACNQQILGFVLKRKKADKPA